MTSFLLYVATVFVWGFSWYAIELQVGIVPLEVSVAYRFGLAALVQFGWCLLSGVRLAMPLRDHVTCAMLGAMLFGVNLLLVYYATANIPSGLVSVVFSMITVINIFNARVFMGRHTKPLVWVAAALGVVGIALIFNQDISAISANVLAGGAFALAGAYIASAGNVFALKVQERGLTVLKSNAWGMAYGALIIAAFALIKGSPFTFEWTAEYIGGLFYLVIFGSVAGFGFYMSLIRRIGPERAGYTAVMFPAVALAVSAILEDLTVTPLMALGAALILFGNVLVLVPTEKLSRLMGRS